MTTYLIGHADGQIRLIMPKGAKVQTSAALTFIEYESSTTPDPSRLVVVNGAVVPGTPPIPAAAKSTVKPPPSQEQFLAALYQQALGNPFPMNAFNQAVVAAKGAKP